MASTGDGFRATIGVMLAMVFMLVVIPGLIVMVLCGGCATLFVVPAVDQARDAAREAEARRQEEANQKLIQQNQPAVQQAPVQAPEKPMEQPAAKPDPEPAKPEPTPEPTPEPEPKPEPKPEPAKPDSTAPSDATEKAAASRLTLAKNLLQKSPDAAKKRLKELVDKFPGTEAAAEAAKLLSP